MPATDAGVMVWASTIGVVLAILSLDASLHHVLAQNPFGVPRNAPAAAQEAGGVIGWMLAKQSEFYRQISGTIRAAKADGTAVWSLLLISFLYGIFHAAGPGHGKAVISSYLVANEETAKRGIALSFVSALLQAVVAVTLVTICAWILNATAKTMCSAERVIEIASYALIAAFGARLVWTKGAGFFRAVQARRKPGIAFAAAGATTLRQSALFASTAAHAENARPDVPKSFALTPSRTASPMRASWSDDHVHDETCGCGHGPEPAQLAGPGGWRRGIGAILAVGLRPCSGAILVLVFAFAQNLYWAGVAATFAMGLGTAITVAAIALVTVSAKCAARRLAVGREGGGMVLLRGIEFGAAGFVLLFGVALLLGYAAAERVTCF